MVAPVNLEFRADDKTGAAFSAIEARLNKLDQLMDRVSGRQLVNANQLDVRGVDQINNALQETARQTDRARRNSRGLRGAFDRLGGTLGNTSGILGTLSSSIPGVGVGLAGLTVGAVALGREILRATDEFSMYRSQLMLVAEAGEDVNVTQSRLLDLANRTRSDIGSTVTLYTRLSQALQSTGAELRGITAFGFTETVQQTVAISAATSQEAAGAVRQSTQALAGNRLSGEEFNSITEQTNFLATQLAEGLGLTIGELRRFGQAGLIGTQEIADAIATQRMEIGEAFQDIAITVDAASTQASNSWRAFLAALGENTELGTAARFFLDLADRYARAARVYVGGIGTQTQTLSIQAKAAARDIQDLDEEIQVYQRRLDIAERQRGADPERIAGIRGIIARLTACLLYTSPSPRD